MVLQSYRWYHDLTSLTHLSLTLISFFRLTVLLPETLAVAYRVGFSVVGVSDAIRFGPLPSHLSVQAVELILPNRRLSSFSFLNFAKLTHGLKTMCKTGDN